MQRGDSPLYPAISSVAPAHCALQVSDDIEQTMRSVHVLQYQLQDDIQDGQDDGQNGYVHKEPGANGGSTFFRVWLGPGGSLRFEIGTGSTSYQGIR